MYNLKIRSEENSSLKYLIMKTKLAINGKAKNIYKYEYCESFLTCLKYI